MGLSWIQLVRVLEWAAPSQVTSDFRWFREGGSFPARPPSDSRGSSWSVLQVYWAAIVRGLYEHFKTPRVIHLDYIKFSVKIYLYYVKALVLFLTAESRKAQIILSKKSFNFSLLTNFDPQKSSIVYWYRYWVFVLVILIFHNFLRHNRISIHFSNTFEYWNSWECYPVTQTSSKIALCVVYELQGKAKQKAKKQKLIKT